MSALVAIGEIAPVTIPRQRHGFGVASHELHGDDAHGPEAGIWVNTLATLRKRIFQVRVPAPRALQPGHAGDLDVHVLQGIPGRRRPFPGPWGGPGDTWRFLTAAIVDTLCNALQFAIYFSLDSGMSLRGVWRLNIQWTSQACSLSTRWGYYMVLVAPRRRAVPPHAVLPASSHDEILAEQVHRVPGRLTRRWQVRCPTRLTQGTPIPGDIRSEWAEYAALLAKEMKFSEDRIGLIRYVGLPPRCRQR